MPPGLQARWVRIDEQGDTSNCCQSKHDSSSVPQIDTESRPLSEMDAGKTAKGHRARQQNTSSFCFLPWFLVITTLACRKWTDEKNKRRLQMGDLTKAGSQGTINTRNSNSRSTKPDRKTPLEMQLDTSSDKEGRRNENPAGP